MDGDATVTPQWAGGRLAGLVASQGPFVADTCARAAPYDVSNIDAFGIALADSVNHPNIYLLLTSSTPKTLESSATMLAACSSCDFTADACQPQPVGTPVTIAGPTYVSASVAGLGTVEFGRFNLSP